MPINSRRLTPSTSTSTGCSTSGRWSRRDDLVSRFLTAEVDGHTLSREDILDICFLFLIAGLDTVTATLDCMFGFLAQNPDHRRQLVDDPSLIPSAIEELLRWETPVSLVARASLEDTTVAGCPVARGDSVILMLGSANTDEDEVEDAHSVRFDREVNRHIAFGGGVHRCLGSHLARMELRVALREWHRRIPEYSVEPGHTLVYTHEHPLHRALPHAVHPGAARLTAPCPALRWAGQSVVAMPPSTGMTAPVR